MSHEDAVVLIPGFLGFERIGHFRYFADRVGATLRGMLGGMAGADRVPVVPVKTCPTEPLVERQKALIQALHGIDSRLGHVERLHLVGHSTGGIDAYLLTGDAPLAESDTWETVDPHDVRRKIRTIVTVSTPHAGTCLALSSLARLVRHPIRNAYRTPILARTMLRLTFSLRVDEMAVGAFYGALTDTGGAAAYVLDVLRSRTLVDDLRPRHMVELQENLRPDPRVRAVQRSVVTMAGARCPAYTNLSGDTGPREPDCFFKDLYQHAAGSGYDDAYDDRERIEDAVALLETMVDQPIMIAHPEVELREITPRLNDGLVAAARQIVDPGDNDEVIALVVGDHIDVMGYYPQWVTACDAQSEAERSELRSGILHSGSGFGDEQFYPLMHRIAGTIGTVIRRSSGRVWRGLPVRRGDEVSVAV